MDTTAPWVEWTKPHRGYRMLYMDTTAPWVEDAVDGLGHANEPPGQVDQQVGAQVEEQQVLDIQCGQRASQREEVRHLVGVDGGCRWTL